MSELTFQSACTKKNNSRTNKRSKFLQVAVIKVESAFHQHGCNIACNIDQKRSAVLGGGGGGISFPQTETETETEIHSS